MAATRAHALRRLLRTPGPLAPLPRMPLQNAVRVPLRAFGGGSGRTSMPIDPAMSAELARALQYACPPRIIQLGDPDEEQLRVKCANVPLAELRSVWFRCRLVEVHRALADFKAKHGFGRALAAPQACFFVLQKTCALLFHYPARACTFRGLRASDAVPAAAGGHSEALHRHEHRARLADDHQPARGVGLAGNLPRLGRLFFCAPLHGAPTSVGRCRSVAE
jgi:hypothetical protein